MSRRLVVPLMCACVLAGCTKDGSKAPAERKSPPPERPLLGPPASADPGAREVFVKDPRGQIERMAAGGHFVAWSVRTPADVIPTEGYEYQGPHPPTRLPRSSKIVIVDERGGVPLSVDLGRRWVRRLRMIRGAGGPAEPQLGLESCTSRDESSCEVELLTLTAEPPMTITARTGGADASAAVEGSLDSGRRIDVERRPCPARLSVREGDGPARTLPPLPARDRDYPRCKGLVRPEIYGDFVLAWVRREAPRYDFEAHFVYELDVTPGASARWREVYRPYRYTAASTGWAVGPAVTDRALYWEELDDAPDDGSMTDLVRYDRSSGKWTSGAPVAPGAPNVCDIAATDGALYELANPRCTVGYGTGTSGEIRRRVNG